MVGVLLGTAIGDALGLPMEGMSAHAVAKHFPQLDRYFFLGITGFVSDDTEQTALVAACLSRYPDSIDGSVRAFRRSLLGWFLRLPWGIGWGTLRACFRIALGLSRSGVPSAGNGAAMRASIVGAFFANDQSARRAFSDAIAQVTHTDVRAIEGARFAAELCALCCNSTAQGDRRELVGAATCVVDALELKHAIELAIAQASSSVSITNAATTLGCSGFVVHSLAIAVFCFLRSGNSPEEAIVAAIRAGGDTDSNAAIVGAWVGALHGARGLPQRLLQSLDDGPFGPSHLRALGADLLSARRGYTTSKAHYSWLHALLRNCALYPVVLTHALRIVTGR